MVSSHEQSNDYTVNIEQSWAPYEISHQQVYLDPSLWETLGKTMTLTDFHFFRLKNYLTNNLEQCSSTFDIPGNPFLRQFFYGTLRSVEHPDLIFSFLEGDGVSCYILHIMNKVRPCLCQKTLNKIKFCIYSNKKISLVVYPG